MRKLHAPVVQNNTGIEVPVYVTTASYQAGAIANTVRNVVASGSLAQQLVHNGTHF